MHLLCTGQPSPVSSGCVLLSGTMVFPDPQFFKVFKDQELQFLESGVGQRPELLGGQLLGVGVNIPT